ncbi:MAG: hypothetical protein ABIG84_07885 [archaeon]
MNLQIRFSGILAWMVLGLVVGFVSYSVLILYSMSGLTIALFAGAFSTVITILLLKEQESDSDKFFIGLCGLSIAALASGVKYFNYERAMDLSVSALVVGVLMGIIVSMALVVYLIND